MELTGRLTENAKASQTKGGKQVVNFSIAINDRYKPKGSEAAKTITTFVNCSYWLNPGITPHLIKGMLVELSGRISASAWTNAQGEPKASLNFHVNTIKMHGKSNASGGEAGPVTEKITEAIEDLPF
jgi:single-strand DNA-binding protein